MQRWAEGKSKSALQEEQWCTITERAPVGADDDYDDDDHNNDFDDDDDDFDDDDDDDDSFH